MSEGWIKIDRKIFGHWVYDDPWKFRNWIDLIGMANYSEKKVEIDSEIFVCNRGELLRSLKTLAMRWKCSKSKVRRFLQLLEKDSMIVVKNERKTTRITICKYDSYQIDETATKRKRNADETQKDPNKNVKKITIEELKVSLSKKKGDYPDEMLKDFYLYWTEVSAKGKYRFQEQKAFSVERRLITWSRNQKKFSQGENDLQNYVKNRLKK